MSWFDEKEELLLFGAKLEQIGEVESAQKVYTSYVKDAAMLSDGDDALEFFYGRMVYDAKISTYQAAIECAQIALCAKKLVHILRNKFGTPRCWDDSVKEKTQDKKLLRFFEWISEPKSINKMHYNTLKNAKRILESETVLKVCVSSVYERQGVMELIRDLALGYARVTDKGVTR